MSPPWDLRSKGKPFNRGALPASLVWVLGMWSETKRPRPRRCWRPAGCGWVWAADGVSSGLFPPSFFFSLLPSRFIHSPPIRVPKTAAVASSWGKLSAACGLLSRLFHSPGFCMVQGPVLKIWKSATLESLSYPPTPQKGMRKTEGHVSNSSPRGCVVTCHLGGGSRGCEEQAARAVRPTLGCGGPLAGVSAQTPAC